MSYRTKIQVIKRKSGHEQWYVNFPSALAQAMSFAKSEGFEWIINRKNELILKRMV